MQAGTLTDVRFSGRSRLLVSVRNAEEALAAVTGGAEIIDVKEPAEGPLGMASPDAILSVVKTLSGLERPIPLSAALGELRDFPLGEKLPAFCRHLDWVKVGLSGLGTSDWQSRWRKLQDDLRSQSPATGLIAVVYADWKACAAPSPEAVISAALAVGASGILFDTYAKRGKNLLDHVSIKELTEHRQKIHAAKRFVALAGSLGLPQIELLAKMNADILAVRTAACVGGRRGHVDADRVATLLTAMMWE